MDPTTKAAEAKELTIEDLGGINVIEVDREKDKKAPAGAKFQTPTQYLDKFGVPLAPPPGH